MKKPYKECNICIKKCWAIPETNALYSFKESKSFWEQLEGKKIKGCPCFVNSKVEVKNAI